MMSKKLAVPPVAPNAVPRADNPPDNWRDAFVWLSDRMLKMIGKQASDVQALRSEVADMRGVMAAAGKSAADLATAIESVDVRDSVQNLEQTVRSIDERTVKQVEEINGAIQSNSQWIQTLDERIVATGDSFTNLGKVVADLVAAAGTLETDLRAIVASTGEAVAGAVADIDDRIAGVVTKVTDMVADESARRVDTVDAVVVKIDGVIDHVREMGAYVETRAGELAERITAVTDKVEAAGELRSEDRETIAACVERTGELAEKVTGLVQAASHLALDRAEDHAAIEALTKDVAAAAAGATEAITTIRDTIKFQAEDSKRIAAVEEAVTGFVSTAAAIGSEVRRIDARVADAHVLVDTVGGEARDAVRRVTIALGELPAGMLIDRDGDLVRVNRAGDMTKLGKVVAEAPEVRDGRDAPRLVASKIEGDRFILVLSDGAEISCSVAGLVAAKPADPAPAVDPTTIGYLSKDAEIRGAQVADMQELRAKGQTFKRIAEKYKISPRSAARLIKGLKDDDES